MNTWKPLNFSQTLDWLLEKDNPSVRLFTLMDILNQDVEKESLNGIRQEIMESQPVSQILANQKEDGNWEKEKQFYTAKYRGTAWTLIILAELGADGRDPRIQKGCEFVLNVSQESRSGGFSIRSDKSGSGIPSGVIPCLTGNMVWSLIKFGYLNDPRLQQSINWITTYQRFDDGEGAAPKGWPYDGWQICWGSHTCHMGVVKSLKALSAIPCEKRSPEVCKTLENGAEFMLIHHVHKRSHNLTRVSKPGWKKLGFPRMYQTDVLEIVDILTKLGHRDPRMQEAVDLIAAKQLPNGRWLLEDTFNGKFQTNIEQHRKESKWITLKALGALKRFYA